MGLDFELEEFAQLVGDVCGEPVWLSGHQTRQPGPPGVRTICAPSGILDIEADEMTVRCGAGTPVEDLQSALHVFGQYVNLPHVRTGSGTVGGALSVGRGDIFRLGRGAMRDSLLQVKFVGHAGQIVKAGGPTVKNVSGFDLCRLLVGAKGRLGFMGEVILRTRPIPPSLRWFQGDTQDLSVVLGVLQDTYRPASILYNGKQLWLALEGFDEDIQATAAHVHKVLEDFIEVSQPPNLGDYPYRWSIPPSEIGRVLDQYGAGCVAEMGIGIIHHCLPAPIKIVSPTIKTIETRLLDEFNPSRRLNPNFDMT